MKRFFVGMAAMAVAATMSAASYTVFDIANPGTWTEKGTGFTSTMTAGGQTFTITTDKASSSTTLISPDANTYAWRVYKNSSFTIEASIAMKSIVITYDDYVSGSSTYYAELSLSSGWNGTLAGVEYTLINEAGSATFTGIAEKQQVRIKTIVVSDEVGSVTPPVTPDLPENVVYRNSFEENMDGWVKINDEALSDFNGWKINTSETAPKCAICNSYYGGANHAADAKMQMEFDLTNWKNCAMTVSQAFGYDFPTAQVENYTLYIICDGDTEELAFSNFPEAPASGNWSKSFAVNNFDLSEYDGEKVTIGFRYLTDGSTSRAWEIKDFEITGEKKTGSVESLVNGNAKAEYYTLQGVRIAEPQNGINIVVKNGKASKVVF